MSPDTVAEYAKKDSRALSKVDSSDLLDELLVRLVEGASLPAEDLYKEIEGLISKYKERVKEDER
tara:strand:- start:626 stop:820 length:195 start_codon:yes stop_codon:yes gene_type:complete